MKTQTPEDAVAATAATVATCAAELRKIEAQIASEQRAIMIARQDRDQHTSASARGDTHAMAVVQKAKAQQCDAEQRLADLFNNRWPAAQRELVAAEQALENAKRAQRRPHDEAKKREIVAASARIDRRNAENTADYELRQRLLLELPAQDDGMVSRYEDRIGLRRVYAALPAYQRSLPANPTAQFIPLAESDRQFLSLSPEPDEKPKAA